ncbi:MAG: helix-turn-helix domain-containing protein [Solirubrobacterales bacterium]
MDTEDLMAHVGAKLRAARKKHGHSQEQVAALAGIHRTEVGLIERGQRMPRYDTLLKLAGAIGVEPGEFFQGARWVPDLRPGKKGGQFETSR